MSRYLGSTSGNLDLAKEKLKADIPYHLMELDRWHSLNEDEKQKYGPEYIAIYDGKELGNIPVIRSDFMIYWFER